MNPTWQEFKAMQIPRLRRIITETQQLIDDVEAWNRFHPADRPIDCEGDRITLVMARRCLTALTGDARELYTRLTHDLVEYAKNAVAEGEVTAHDFDCDFIDRMERGVGIE